MMCSQHPPSTLSSTLSSFLPPQQPQQQRPAVPGFSGGIPRPGLGHDPTATSWMRPLAPGFGFPASLPSAPLPRYGDMAGGWASPPVGSGRVMLPPPPLYTSVFGSTMPSGETSTENRKRKASRKDSKPKKAKVSIPDPPPKRDEGPRSPPLPPPSAPLVVA